MKIKMPLFLLIASPRIATQERYENRDIPRAILIPVKTQFESQLWRYFPA